MEFQELSDEKLIELYKSGNETAIDIIFERYKNLVRKKVRVMYLAGGDNDDLIQEGMIGLYKAVRDFDAGKQVSFTSFASMCISRHLMTVVTASNRKKNAPLNSYLSFDMPANISEDSDIKLVELLPSESEQNPELLVIDQEHTEILQKKISSLLSTFEKNVLDLYLGGMDYIQIANELDKSPKSIDNALQRIRTKAGKAGVR